jgi:hypothetical protein
VQSEGAAHHVHAGRDGGVDEQPLIGRKAGVGDGPPEVARHDVLLQPKVIIDLYGSSAWSRQWTL